MPFTEVGSTTAFRLLSASKQPSDRHLAALESTALWLLLTDRQSCGIRLPQMFRFNITPTRIMVDDAVILCNLCVIFNPPPPVLYQL